MRKFPIVLLILIVTISILWVFAGRQISWFVDRFEMSEIESVGIHSIAYEGSGDGGTLVAEDHRLTLSPLNPHVGSTKDNQLALAHAGKVFAFGLLRSPESLASGIESGDTAVLKTQGSYIVWPSFSAAQLTWNRAEYFKLTWHKQNGAKLEMLWSVDAAKNPASLIRIDISSAAR
jgi:hypothetical protein